MPLDDESLPRDNGDLVFAAPWQARALAIAVAVVEKLDLPWDVFRQHLMAEIAADPQRPYYDSWGRALESMVLRTRPRDTRGARRRHADRARAALAAVCGQHRDPRTCLAVGDDISDCRAVDFVAGVITSGQACAIEG